MHISGIEIGFDQGEIQPSLCPAPPPPFPGGGLAILSRVLLSACVRGAGSQRWRGGRGGWAAPATGAFATQKYQK